MTLPLLNVAWSRLMPDQILFKISWLLNEVDGAPVKIGARFASASWKQGGQGEKVGYLGGISLGTRGEDPSGAFSPSKVLSDAMEMWEGAQCHMSNRFDSMSRLNYPFFLKVSSPISLSTLYLLFLIFLHLLPCVSSRCRPKVFLQDSLTQHMKKRRGIIKTMSLAW